MSLWDNVDWKKYAGGVHSRAQDSTGRSHTALGDPIKWGARDTQLIIDPVPELVRVFQGPQFVRAQVADTYPRAWSVIGTLDIPQLTWGAAVGQFLATLEITMGVGQAYFVHQVDLRLLTTTGLAIYRPTFSGAPVREARAFSLVGSLIGQAISMRMIYSVALATPGLLTAQPAIVNAVVTPLAAGTGL